MEPLRHQAGKKRFRINDLAEELQIKKFVIKQWEKEFNLNATLYSTQDLDFFKKVKELVYEQKLPLTQIKELLAPMLVRPAVQAAAPLVEEESVTAAVQAAEATAEVVGSSLVQEASEPEVLEAAAPESAVEEVMLHLGDAPLEAAVAIEPAVVCDEASSPAGSDERVLAATKEVTPDNSAFYEELSFFKQELLKFQRLLGA